MPSPFPGMNPYVEQDDVWEDFHGRFVTFAAGELTAQIRPNYIAKTAERIYIREPSAEERRFVGQPDVSIAAVTSVARDTATAGGRASLATLNAPIYARLPVQTERQRYIQILDRRNRDLITIVELISPSNKRSGADREQYIAKRREVLASPSHFVEIDLLRGGPRLPLEDLPHCDYYALVAVAGEREHAGLWPIRLRDELPTIPIPLRSPDQPAQLNLKRVLDQLYDNAGYEDYIYGGSPHPALHPDDLRWAQQFLPQKL